MMRDELFETDASFVLNLKFSIPSLIYDPLGFFSISLRNYYYFWKSNNLCTKKIRIGFRLLTRFSSFAYLSSRNRRAIVSSLLIRLFESESYQRSKEISLYARLNEPPRPTLDGTSKFLLSMFGKQTRSRWINGRFAMPMFAKSLKELLFKQVTRIVCARL